MLSASLHEIAAALRSLRRSPGFAALAIAMLALGIGANVAIFSIFHSIVLSPLPYPAAERLVGFSSANAAKALTQPALSAADFRDVHERAKNFSALAAFRPDFVSYAPASGEPVQLIVARVTEDFFPLFGLAPLQGRTFRLDEFPAAAPRTAVVSAACWRRQFGARRDLVGSTVTLDRQPTTIVGVMPEEFREPEFVDVWLPFDPDAPENLARDSRYWTTIGRLKPDATLAGARTEAQTIATALAGEYAAVDQGWTMQLQPLLELRVGSIRTSLLLLVGAVGLVLLVACVNLANLLLARGLVRLPQLAVRLALGATSAALARAVLLESLLLSLAGGVAGVGVSAAALAVLASRLPPGLIPRSHAIHLDGTALAFAIVVSLLTGLAFGFLPAWQVRRANVNDLLKSAGARGTPGRFTGRVQGALVAAQVALTLVVLTGATLLAQSLIRLQATAPGFDPRGVLAVRIALGQERWNDMAELGGYYERLLDELRRTPGVEAASLDCSAPLSGIALHFPFSVRGRPRSEGNSDEAIFNSVSADLPKTLRLPVVRGRFIDARDDLRAPRVCVINAAFARRVFPDQDPIGQRVQTVPWLGSDFREIVGIVADTRAENLSDPPPPQIYVPSRQSPWFFTTLLVRVGGTAGTATVHHALRRVDPALTMTVHSVEENIALTTTQPRLRAWLFGAFAIGALALSAFGIYASMAFTVSQRTREIGVRVALGASPRAILGWVLGRAVRVSALGLAVGLGGAFALARLLRSVLPNIEPADPLLLVALAAFLAVVALLASAQPAFAASRLNPTRALQQD
ncbi:MAG TPA: ABC transporter permease [Opitutaceae bacterium]|nr:ABC transporter permease [Opitutaceae bacterium]